MSRIVNSDFSASYNEYTWIGIRINLQIFLQAFDLDTMQKYHIRMWWISVDLIGLSILLMVNNTCTDRADFKNNYFEIEARPSTVILDMHVVRV